MSTLQVTNILSNTANTPPVIYDSTSTQVGTFCRAWVNFDGTASPGSIKSSFNVTSITNVGTGVYTVNFTNSMPDANYVSTINASRPATDFTCFSLRGNAAQTTSGVTIVVGTTGFVLASTANTVQVAIFR